MRVDRGRRGWEGTSLALQGMPEAHVSTHRSVGRADGRGRTDGRNAMARGNIPNGFFVHFVYLSLGAARIFCSFCRSDMAEGQSCAPSCMLIT